MCVQRPWHKLVVKSVERGKREFVHPLYMYTKCCMCVWIWACRCVFCLCCMHSLNPLQKLDTAHYRHRSHFSQVTLLPLSPLPPFFSHHPLSSSFVLPSYLYPFLFLFLPSPSPMLALRPLFFCTLLDPRLLQPLMTCLKPMGSTVREGTEALPSHRPSQQAAAQGKVHTQHLHTL